MDWPLLKLPPEAPIAVEVLRPERTLGGIYAINGDLVASLLFGQMLKRIRQDVGEPLFEVAGVMSAGDLQCAPGQLTIDELWRAGSSDPRFAEIADIASGRHATVDL